MGDGISHLNLCGGLDAGNDVAYVAALNAVGRFELHLKHANLVCHILFSCVEELDLVAFAYASVHNLEVGYDAAEGIEYRVKNKGLERCLGVSDRCGNLLYDGIQKWCDAFSGTG